MRAASASASAIMFQRRRTVISYTANMNQAMHPYSYIVVCRGRVLRHYPLRRLRHWVRLQPRFETRQHVTNKERTTAVEND